MTMPITVLPNGLYDGLVGSPGPAGAPIRTPKVRTRDAIGPPGLSNSEAVR
jgi:hypothetical protein